MDFVFGVTLWLKLLTVVSFVLSAFLFFAIMQLRDYIYRVKSLREIVSRLQSEERYNIREVVRHSRRMEKLMDEAEAEQEKL